ncbi:MAG: sulfite exporter TauE/SafE family protein [Bacteroidota bacterium]
MDFFSLLGIGLLAGIVAGLLGVGGGIIFTPVLFVLFDEAGVENPVIWTIGSGLFCTFVATTGSTIRQYVQNNMFWSEGIKLGVLGSIGVFLGKLIVTSPYYNRVSFVLFFTAMLVYVSFMMIRRGRDVHDEYERDFGVLGWLGAFFTGGAGGFVAALAGVGGGGIMVPIMNTLYKQPFRKAVSISQLGMTIMVATGWIQLALLENPTTAISPVTLGYVDFGAAFPLSLGGLIGGFGGALLNHQIPRRYLQIGFALLTLAVATKLLTGIL